MGRSLLLAAMLAAAIVAPAVAQPPPPPPPPPPLPGMSQSDYADSLGIMSDLARYLAQTRRNAAWPSTTRVPIRGMSASEFSVFADDALRNGGMIDIAGQFTGPGDFSQSVTRTIRDNQGPNHAAIAPGVWAVFTARAEGGAIDLAGGVRREGVSHLGSVEGAGSGAPFTLDLGDGYKLRATATFRPANDNERRINVRLADGLMEERRIIEARRAQQAVDPATPVIFSAFTNSVIREGDARARSEAK